MFARLLRSGDDEVMARDLAYSRTIFIFGLLLGQRWFNIHVFYIFTLIFD